MPPKAKLHKTTGKSMIPKLQQNLNEPSTSGAILLTPEVEQQFEVELCWCIQQLQIALKSGKLINKQVQDHTKALNTLMSNSAPIVKKRQVMRLSFGDYRAKMAAEDKKTLRNALNMKVKPAMPSKKSVFVKKSNFISSGNTFKFNFQSAPEDDLSNNISNVKIECENSHNNINSDICNTENNYHFVPSNNSFRFRFNESGEL